MNRSLFIEDITHLGEPVKEISLIQLHPASYFIMASDGENLHTSRFVKF
ncbi:MAG TPA: hypothetical protein ACFCUD_09965 [Cyclobacteriaceae bacterium]